MPVRAEILAERCGARQRGDVQVRARKYRSGRVAWEADCGFVNGKRVAKCFKTKKEAEDHLALMKGKMRDHGHAAFKLTEDDRIQFVAARERLATAGATVGQAVDFFLSHHRPLKAELTMVQLFEACALDKELTGMRKRSLQQFRCSCRSFLTGRADLLARTIDRDEVKRWILGSGFAPKTQKTYLGDLRALFAWGVTERYLQRNPIAGEEGFIQLAAEEEKEITVLDVEQCARLLRAALFADYVTRDRGPDGRWNQRLEKHGLRELIGFLVVAMMAGVRPEEIRRTEADRLDLPSRTLVITGAAAKRVKKRGRQRRVIELERTAVIWLRLWRRMFPSSPLVPKNFDRKWDALRAAAGLTDWPHDVLRHTFASYHYAAHANRSRLQALMGHTESEDTLDQHYRAIKTLGGKTLSVKLAREFWALTPRKARLLITHGRA